VPGRIQAQEPLPAASATAIDQVFADIEEAAPGCALGVIADNELAYTKGFGLAKLDHGLPITTRSNFYLGSVGKQFTAGAIVHAERAGHLSLDDPIEKWIADIPEYDPTDHRATSHPSHQRHPRLPGAHEPGGQEPRECVRRR
jgi:CubicO group peptidase (beta-lactamase class C family)